MIGNDVYIGRDALVLSGVDIGNGAVAAASSVVTEDVVSYSIVAENPVRHIKVRFNKGVRVDLKRSAWWD